MAESATTTQNAPATETRVNGCVKWFNNKRGYGFISLLDGDRDIFVHQANIRSEGYRTLQNGEYVSFVISKNDSQEHPEHATDVSGISGGKLLCEQPRTFTRTYQPRYNGGRGNGRGGSRGGYRGAYRGGRRQGGEQEASQQ